MSVYTSTAMRKPKHGEKCSLCGRRVPARVKVFRGKPRRVSVNRDPEYRKWLREQACALTGNAVAMTEVMPPEGWVVVDAAHTQNNGMSSKGPDSSCAPLCRVHHREYDKDRKGFEKRYGVDMRAIAAEHYARFQKEKEQPK